MLTVYANRGDKIVATHYCMVGNQPQFQLKKSDGSTFVFEMSGIEGIANKNDMHMHGVTIHLRDNKLKQEWTNYKDNKKGEVVIFEFNKKI